MADAVVTDYAGPHRWIAKGVLKSQWTTVAGATTCLPLDAPHLPDKTVQATGTWGGATLVVQGSADNVTYVGLNDSRGEGNAISMSADNIVTIAENPQYIRAVTSGGTGTSLTVTITSQSTQR